MDVQYPTEPNSKEILLRVLDISMYMGIIHVVIAKKRKKLMSKKLMSTCTDSLCCTCAIRWKARFLDNDGLRPVSSPGRR